MTLSLLLEGVISQRLVTTKENERMPAVEVMLKTKRISELIAENRDEEILESIEKGKEIYGSQSFDQSLFELYTQNKITKSVALRNATNPSDMSLLFQGIKKGTGYENVRNIKQTKRSAFELK